MTVVFNIYQHPHTHDRYVQGRHRSDHILPVHFAVDFTKQPWCNRGRKTMMGKTTVCWCGIHLRYADLTAFYDCAADSLGRNTGTRNQTKKNAHNGQKTYRPTTTRLSILTGRRRGQEVSHSPQQCVTLTRRQVLRMRRAYWRIWAKTKRWECPVKVVINITIPVQLTMPIYATKTTPNRSIDIRSWAQMTKVSKSGGF